MCEVEHSLGRDRRWGCHQHLITRLPLSPSPFLLALQGLQGPLQRQQEGWASTPWWQERAHPRLFLGYLSSHWPIPFHCHRLMDLVSRRGIRGHFVLQMRKLSLSEIILGTGTPGLPSLTPVFLSFCICEMGIPALPSQLPQAFRARSGWAGSRGLAEGPV